MQRPGRKSAFSIEERRRIVAEYEQGDMSVKALCQKYGLRSPVFRKAAPKSRFGWVDDVV